MPNLGDYVPENWELVETHFVDSSGFGAENELALTLGQFTTLVRTEIANKDEIFGWALMSAGQFQVYIGQFRSNIVDSDDPELSLERRAAMGEMKLETS